MLGEEEEQEEGGVLHLEVQRNIHKFHSSLSRYNMYIYHSTTLSTLGLMSSG
jgi:hypothetical protein